MGLAWDEWDDAAYRKRHTHSLEDELLHGSVPGCPGCHQGPRDYGRAVEVDAAGLDANPLAGIAAAIAEAARLWQLLCRAGKGAAVSLGQEREWDDDDWGDEYGDEYLDGSE